MADQYDSNPEDSEDEAQAAFEVYPSFVMIAVDCDACMFLSDEFKTAIKACYSISNSLVGSNMGDCHFAVVLVRDEDNILVKFTDNLIETTRKLKEIFKMPSDDLKNKYMRLQDGAFDLGMFYLFCKKQFNNVTSKYKERTLIYISNDEDPVRGDNVKQFTVFNEARNFQHSDISFHLLPLSENFDLSKFYDEFYKACNIKTEVEVCPTFEHLEEKLSTYIVKKIIKYRQKFYPFKNKPDISLSCHKINYIQDIKLLNNAAMHTDGTLAREINVQAGEIDNIIEIGCKPYEFSKELSEEKKNEFNCNNFNLGYTLYSVTERVTPIGFVLKAPHLLVVDTEEKSPYFEQFWQYCVNKNKVLVCVYKVSKSSSARYVELIPKYINSTRMFMVKYIPYGNEINYPTLTPLQEEITPHQEKLVKKLTDKLKYDYDPGTYIDIPYAKKKAYIRSFLLNEKEEEITNVDLIEEVIETHLEDITKIFSEENMINFEESKKRKRKAKNQ